MLEGVVPRDCARKGVVDRGRGLLRVLTMFAPFERLLKPTAVSEAPEAPPGLLAFYWHFARQAKGL